MLKLDAIDLLDLSEAGEMLLRDPARLRRQIRTRQIPAAMVLGTWGVPLPWAEAAAGIAPVDESSLRTYWLERLAPPSTEAHRVRRPVSSLDDPALLTEEEAAYDLCADPKAIARLTQDRTLPALRIDGKRRYDAELVMLLGRRSAGEDVGTAFDARLQHVLELARFEYTSEELPAPVRFTPRPAPKKAPPAGPIVVPAPPESSSPEEEAQTEAETLPAAAKAWEMPDDLKLPDTNPIEPGPSKLLDADGFEAVDEY